MTDKLIHWGTIATSALTALLTFERALEATATSPVETHWLHATGIAVTAAVAAIGAILTVLRGANKS